MNKAALAITLGLGTCIAGGLFGTALIGRSVVARLGQETRQLDQYFPLEVVEETIEHGIFHSSRIVKLRLGCMPKALPNLPHIEPNQPLEFSLRDDVHHGPFVAGSGFALAAIRSQLLLPEAAEAAWKQIGGKGPALSVYSVFRFDGSFESSLRFPGLRHSESGTELEIEPILANFRGTFGNRPVSEISLETERVALHAKNDELNFSLSLDQLRADMQTEAAPEGAKFLRPGKSLLKVKSLQMKAGPTKLDRLAPFDARFVDLVLTGKSEQKSGAYSAETTSEAHANVNQLDAGKLSSKSTLRNVDASLYEAEAARFIATFFKCDADDKSGDQRATRQAEAASLVEAYTASLIEVLPKMLLKDPEYVLDYLRLERGGKRAEISYRAASEGVMQADLTADKSLASLLLEKGTLALKAQLSMALLEELASEVALAATGSSEEGASAVAMLKVLLQPAIQMGYVVKDGDTLKAHGELRAGKLSFNDAEPFPASGMLELFGP